MLNRLDSVVFFVDDIHAASRWYAELLDVEVNYENEHYAYVSFGGGKFGFHPEDKKSNSGLVGQTSYWDVVSLKEVINRFIERGAALYRGPMKTDFGQYACIIQDPFSNTLGLISDQP